MKFIKFLLPVFVFSMIFSACNQQKEVLTISDRDSLRFYSLPVQLNPEETEIYLTDFFPDSEDIDSFKVPDYFQQKFDSEKSKLVLSPEKEDFPFLSVLKIFNKGNCYDFLMKKSEKKLFTFSFDPKGKAYSEVAVRGEINNWNSRMGVMDENKGVYEKEFWLIPGEYQYLLVLDGKDMLDPENPDSVSNNIGGFNSLMKIESSGIKPPEMFTKSFDNENVIISVEGQAEQIFVFWQDRLLGKESLISSPPELAVSIPSMAKKTERSYLRIYASNRGGISKEIMIPLQYGHPVSDVSEISRSDWHSAIMYNVFVDRFFNADTTNDFPVDDPRILPQANHHGGDILGVMKKIEDGYFHSLGVNTIWISPVVQNALGAYGEWLDPYSKFSGYHGYWPISFTQIDFRFGDSGQFSELVAAAHENNMNFLVDFVANHVHENHPVYKSHPDWATNLYLPDGTLNTEKWDEYRLTTWFDTFLPTLDLSKAEVYQMLSDSLLYWVEKYNIDGFRHDATKHIPNVFWRNSTQKIRDKIVFPNNKSFYQLGETYGTRELIASYISSGKLDAQFDFNVYDDAISSLANSDGSFIKLWNSLEASFKYFGQHNLMAYITGNQDRGRFISYAGGSLKFDEDAKAAGWQRVIDAGNPVSYKKLAMLMAFNMTIPGIPVIYYGDEFGMPGGNDPDCRRMMRFDNLSENELKNRDITSKLTEIRSSNMALIYGQTKLIDLSDNVLIYSRKYFQDEVIIAFNKSNEAKTIAIQTDKQNWEVNFGSKLTVSEEIKLDLDAWSFEILTLKK